MNINCRNVSWRTVNQHNAIWYIQLANRCNYVHCWHFSQRVQDYGIQNKVGSYETLLYVNALALWNTAYKIPQDVAVLMLVVTIITAVSSTRTLCAWILTHWNVHDCQGLKSLPSLFFESDSAAIFFTIQSTTWQKSMLVRRFQFFTYKKSTDANANTNLWRHDVV